MFDISFSQIIIIALVAMIVIGPARLPKAVRTLGLLLGRAQRYVSEIKADLHREMELEELRKVKQSIQDIGKDIEQSVQSVVKETEKTVKQAEDSVKEMGLEMNRMTSDMSEAQIANEDTITTVALTEETTTKDAVIEKAPAEETLTTAIKAEEEQTTTDTMQAVSEETVPESGVELSAAVPAFLQGEVELSIPDATSASPQKTGA